MEIDDEIALTQDAVDREFDLQLEQAEAMGSLETTQSNAGGVNTGVMPPTALRPVLKPCPLLYAQASTVTEREKQEQFLYLLLQLATRRERQVIKENREPFLLMMRELRRLVQQMSPDGEFRQYEWRRIRRLADPLINNFVAGFTERLMPELVALEAPVQEFAQDYADLEETSFVPQTEEQVLRNVFIDNSKLPLAAYLIFNGRLMQDLLTKFNRVVDVGLLRGDSTETIANNVLPLTMRNGRVVGVVKTGSYANNASAQINNTLTARCGDKLTKLKAGVARYAAPTVGLECSLGLANLSGLLSTRRQDRPRTSDVCLDGL